MVKKKSKPKKRFAVKEIKAVLPQGFFQRLKDIIPEQKKENVRVKTFIVEKPVYVQAPPQRITAPYQKYDFDAPAERFDSKKSRYSKRSSVESEEELVEEEMEDEETPKRGKARKQKSSFDEYNASGRTDRRTSRDKDFDASLDEDELASEEEAGEFAEGANDFSDDGAQGDLGDESSEDGLTDEESLAEPELPQKSHVRSRGLFLNVWWKKALLWAFIWWIILLIIAFVFQVLQLVEVDLTRQWWMLLAGLIVISLFYFKVFEGKLSI